MKKFHLIEAATKSHFDFAYDLWVNGSAAWDIQKILYSFRDGKLRACIIYTELF